MNKCLLLICLVIVPGHLRAQPEAVDPFIAGYARDHQFSGTIVIQNNGTVDYAHSFGLANIPFKVPNSRQTKYKIASITKAFTSVLILQLYEAGKLDLHETIKHYLPRYAGPAADKVTIHQLMNHTSGLDNIDKVKGMDDAIRNGIPLFQSPFTSEQLLTKFCSGPLVNTPGKVFDYNNADYIVLGKIIEQLYGKPYDQVLKERIVDPLLLADTGMMTQHAIIDNLADTYFFRDDLKALANDFPVYPENWYAAGAMYSTADDLLKFSNALFGLRLLKKATLDLMIKPGLDNYGYGVWSYETKIDGRAYRVVKRPGRIMGAQTELYHIMAPDVTVIILSNTATTNLDEFVAQIGKRLVH
jgi:D-alanyl-D-alanine carboxypeptidase